MRQNIGNDNWSDSVAIVPPLETKFDDTANDSNKSWTVPSNELWKITHAHVILTTTATVGNRQIFMVLRDESGNLIMDIAAGAVQAASLTRHYGFMQGIYRETAFISNEIQVPMPIDCYLGPGYTLQFFDGSAIDAAADDMVVSFQYIRNIV